MRKFYQADDLPRSKTWREVTAREIACDALLVGICLLIWLV